MGFMLLSPILQRRKQRPEAEELLVKVVGQNEI